MGILDTKEDLKTLVEKLNFKEKVERSNFGQTQKTDSFCSIIVPVQLKNGIVHNRNVK